jgi:hypothetical protein
MNGILQVRECESSVTRELFYVPNRMQEMVSNHTPEDLEGKDAFSSYTFLVDTLMKISLSSTSHEYTSTNWEQAIALKSSEFN